MKNSDVLVLIVDNSAVNKEYIRRILQNESYKVAAVSSGVEALEFIQEERPDLILLDVVMPEMDGFQVCEKIKQNPATKDIAVIFISAIDNVDAKVKGFEVGGIDFITKPYYKKEILARIKTHLDLILARNRVESLSHEFESIVNNSMDAIFLIDIKDDQYVYRRFNPVEEELTGLKTEDVRGKTPEEAVGEETGREVSKRYRKCVLLKRTIVYEEELMFSGGKRYYQTKLTPVIKDGQVTQIVGFSRDITERKMWEENIRYISYHDTLTGLFNRAFYEEKLQMLNNERQMPLSIIVGDVNGLKIANDIFGHKAGDDLLIEIADIIKSSVREEDIVARWGGDEFGIILPQTDVERAEEIICIIEEKCRKSDLVPLPPHIALASATKVRPEQNIELIYREAENKMYQKKDNQKRGFNNPLLDSIIQRIESTEYKSVNHTSEIIDLAHLMGKRLSLNENELEKLVLLAKIHDIGKLAISKEILEKKEPFTRREWDEFKTHVEVGYSIANSFKNLQEIANAILHHHERWDGQGYPNGLKKDHTPYLARILRVLDIFDSIKNRVFYPIDVDQYFTRPSTIEEAITELRQLAGSVLEPEIVEVFIQQVVPDYYNDDMLKAKFKR